MDVLDHKKIKKTQLPKFLYRGINLEQFYNVGPFQVHGNITENFLDYPRAGLMTCGDSLGLSTTSAIKSHQSCSKRAGFGVISTSSEFDVARYYALAKQDGKNSYKYGVIVSLETSLLMKCTIHDTNTRGIYEKKTDHEFILKLNKNLFESTDDEVLLKDLFINELYKSVSEIYVISELGECPFILPLG